MTNLLTPQEEAEIRARLAAATPGPHVEHKYIGWGAGTHGLSPAIYFYHHGFQGVYAFDSTTDLTEQENEANYQLAFHAWEDISRLLDSLAVLREENERLAQKLEKMTDIFKAERDARNADAAVNEEEIFK